MTEYAPAAITNLFNQIKAAIPQAILAGIIGDSAHNYGYHRGRNYCASGDYSTQSAADQQGDGEAASALDISWSSAQPQYDVSRRLLNAKNDSRNYGMREFYGSTDGRNVTGWDYPGGYACTSDDSHLWHIHISIQRKYCNDQAAMNAIAAICTGGGSPTPPQPSGDWFDMATEAQLASVVKQQLTAFFANGEGPVRLDQSNGRTRTADSEAVWNANASKETGNTRQTLTDARQIARRAEQAALAAQAAAEKCVQMLEANK